MLRQARMPRARDEPDANVVAFVVLGSTRVEPLDFWWAPLNGWMIAAYAVIITGGLLITRRLHLLALAATFWSD